MDRVTVGGHLTRAFEERVDKFVPKYDMTRVVCLPILITFLFFTQDRHNGGITQNLRNEALPFVRLVAHLVPGADMDPLIREIKHLKDRNRLPEESADQLLQDINSLSSQALKMIGAKRFATAMPAAKDDPQLAQEMQDFLTKRLARGFERQDTGIVNRLWEEARSVFAQPGSKAKFVIPSKIYNQLVSGFMQIKRADLAMSAWNEMVSNGTTPTVVTWTAMIAGCQKGRDLNGLEQIWARMIASGVQPDHAAWGARIYGLISLGQRDKGLAALSEMGKAWKESQTASEPIASKGKSRAKAAAKLSLKSVDHPKPNIEIINGALLALSKAPMRFDRKWDTMELVLRWAESYAIKAGNITYNVLLRLALEEQDTTRVSKILRSMEKDNIEPDIATYTIFMNTALRTSLIELPEAEQTKVVIDFLEDMESRGLKPNSVVYSNLIDRLLKEHNNFVAARSVLDHMARRAIVPSAQIYTSLITHYFALEPPAIDAVDSLWQTIMNTPGSITDRFLFDRLIEGYARCDEIGKMMTVLTRMSKEGKSPSWSALIQVVSALSRAGDFQRVRRVVADVENREGLAKVTLSNRGHWAENHFWELVNQLEIPRGQKDVASSAQ
jgi:pentatricopeptide repeat protein